MNNVHNLYNLPIWITEFNGNVNRTDSVNLEFMKLALPYLDSISYIERYAWFSSDQNCEFFDTLGNLTPIGIYYSNHQSNPSIYDIVWGGRNNLDISDDGIEYNSECILYNINTDVNYSHDHTRSKELLKVTDLLGRETKGTKNKPLFYIYDNGTVEKRIIIE